MKKKTIFLVWLLFSLSMFSQIGINTSTPTATLDVNGDARLRTIPTLSATNVIPIYATSDGRLGTALIAKETQIVSVPPNQDNMSTLSTTDYNNLVEITVPIINPTNINTIGSTITSSGSVTINSAGYYQLNSIFSLYINRDNPQSTDFFWAHFKIFLKRGSTFTELQSSSDILPMPYKAGSYFDHNLPSLIVSLQSGDEISYRIRRVNNTEGTALGVAVNSLKVTPGFTLQKL
ncbi:hypothetical protein [Chryseobacterium sp. AG844]|uniref:hypothetical protein n=1 Tax=Chryseobacterium sp. AG844 TaxID=2183998 RepID=UPI000D71BC55|nr:hypothetical protein [Chryseobacterium sp. AG844]PWW27109.1 hypothetical protein DEU40_10738 [Chryseobacterium sp. AG844]